MSLPVILSLFVGALVSFAGAFLAMQWRVLDHPNGRSAHNTSTPKAGGLGVMAGTLAVLTIVVLTRGLDGQAVPVMALVVLALLTGLLGLYDDVRELPARLKFLILALLAVSAARLVHPVQEFALDHAQLVLPIVLSLLGTGLWVFVLSNATNFMDGSDALVAISGAMAALTLAVLALADGQAITALLALALMVSLLGFLPWNLPPARIFLGDTGALFIGFWLAGTALFYIHDGPPGAVYAVVLVFMPWLSDILLTMAWRAMRHEDLLQAHNDHVYQLALRSGFSHLQVALGLGVQTALCGLLAFVFRSSATSELLALASIASLAIIGHWWARAAFAARRRAH
jgi:UDP-GlcNAc:undecaprenyl-phosphate/decaprenyl-phosphate GlcNAc-1-phosphate transferase